MKQYIILVAGYDFSNGGVDFSYIADKRRSDLISRNPSWQNDPDVIFVRMDVKTGKIEKNSTNGTSRKWNSEPTSFTAINRATQYRDNHFIQAESTVMSITDCYKYVSDIGSTEAGTVQEFSVLGHGWFGGPVIVNTFQRDEYNPGGDNSSVRDPWDKDGRTKDFFAQNMNEADWNNFRNAFAPNGYCWIWGCMFSRAYFDTLNKIMQTTAYRNKTLGSHLDEDLFSISVNANFATSYYNVDPQFFPADVNELTITRSLLDIKRFLQRGMKRAYPGRFAADTGITCIAAYLGTYADYERVYPGHSPAHTVMAIPRNMTVYGADFTRNINFFKTYLGMAEDAENRGYGIYSPTQLSQWWMEH